MIEKILMQYLAICLYVVFVGYCFCDGFGLPVKRKLIWFFTMLLVCFTVLKVGGESDLVLILPVPTALALLLCYDQKRNGRAGTGAR